MGILRKKRGKCSVDGSNWENERKVRLKSTKREKVVRENWIEINDARIERKSMWEKRRVAPLP